MKALREPFTIGNLQVTLTPDNEVEVGLGEERTRLDFAHVSLLRYLLEALANEGRGKYPHREGKDLGPTVRETLGHFTVKGQRTTRYQS